MSAHWILIHWLTTGGCAWRRCNELLFFLVGEEDSFTQARNESLNRGNNFLIQEIAYIKLKYGENGCCTSLTSFWTDSICLVSTGDLVQ